MAASKSRRAGRSAITGKFVKLSYARKHKRTTVVENLKKGKRR
jgi:hypothetical protein